MLKPHYPEKIIAVAIIEDNKYVREAGKLARERE